MKKRRLFVNCEGTDGWIYCGGPVTADALQGLMNCIEPHIDEIMRPGSTEEPNIMLEIREMTDEEVEALPEL